MKLDPTIKLTGKFTVSSINKFTLFLYELFCIATIKNKNKQELKVAVKNNFLKGKIIYFT